VVVNGENILLLEGVSNGYSAYAMHWSEEIYGNDVACFLSRERLRRTLRSWLSWSKPTTPSLLRQWQCLGKPVAQLGVGKMVIKVRWTPLATNYVNMLTDDRPCATSMWHLSARHLPGIHSITLTSLRYPICGCKFWSGSIAANGFFELWVREPRFVRLRRLSTDSISVRLALPSTGPSVAARLCCSALGPE
jgi:hypothetical protein